MASPFTPRKSPAASRHTSCGSTISRSSRPSARRTTFSALMKSVIFFLHLSRRRAPPSKAADPVTSVARDHCRQFSCIRLVRLLGLARIRRQLLPRRTDRSGLCRRPLLLWLEPLTLLRLPATDADHFFGVLDQVIDRVALQARGLLHRQAGLGDHLADKGTTLSLSGTLLSSVQLVQHLLDVGLRGGVLPQCIQLFLERAQLLLRLP